MSEENKDLGDEGEKAKKNAKKKAENLGDKAKDTFDKGKEEAKDLGDKAEEAFDNAKEKAKEFSEDTKKKAKEFSEDTKKKANEFSEGAKEKAGDFADEAKKTANEFSEGAKEAFSGAGGENKKLLTGILAIVLGGFGIHKFILGYTKEGIILLVATIILGVLTCGLAGWVAWVIGLIEGIIYLTKSDEEFYNTYQVGKKPWF